MILDDTELGVGEPEIGIISEDPIVETPETTSTETESTIETETAIVPETQETETQNSIDWLKAFNEATGGNFSTVDEVKSKFGATTPQEEDNGLKTEFDTLKAKHERLIEEYKKNTDPYGLFKDEIELKKNLLMKSNSMVNGDVADKLFNIDLEKGDPLDIIALDLRLNYKSIKSGDAAKDYFKANHGIDADSFEDMTDAQRMIIDIEAEKAAKNIATLRSSVEIPQARSMEDILAEVSLTPQAEYDMTKWDGKIEEVVKAIKEIKVDVGDFTYSEVIDDEFKEGLTDVITETIKKGKIEPTKENIELLVHEAEVAYKSEKFDLILKRAIAQAEVRFKEATHKAIHNDADPDKVTVVAPASSGRTTDLLAQWGLPKY